MESINDHTECCGPSFVRDGWEWVDDGFGGRQLVRIEEVHNIVQTDSKGGSSPTVAIPEEEVLGIAGE